MKKVIVVCRADPRSRSCPRPIPSKWDKNSFSPLEMRDARGTNPGPAFAAFTGEGATAVATWSRAGAIPCRGIPSAFPVRNLPNRLILVRYFSPGLHRQGLDRRCRGGFFVGASAPCIVTAHDFHFAVNLSSLFDGNTERLDVATNVAGAPHFDSIAATE